MRPHSRARARSDGRILRGLRRQHDGLGTCARWPHLTGRAMQAHIYALKSWTIKKRGDEFYIAPTGERGTHPWRGPYRTLQRAASAIARKLEWECSKRHKKTTVPQADRP